MILAIYGLIEINNIRHNVFVGQDCGLHETYTQQLLANPSQWFIGNFTERPLLYWIGGVCSRIGDGEFTYQRAALAVVILSVVALGFFYASTRHLIGSLSIRLAALAFTAFLPLTMITAVVYAADTVALLPFAVACWALGRALDCNEGKPRLGFAVLTGLALVIGQLTRFTFIFTPAGVFLTIGLHWFSRRITTRLALIVLGLAGVLPLGVGLTMHLRASAVDRMHPTSIQNHFEWKGTGEMTWRSVLLIKSSDRRILDAPTYWDFQYVDGKIRRALLVPNNFSYLALLHLGIFTDMMNFAPGGWNDARNGRPERQQMFSIISVRTGLLFSILITTAIILFAFQIAKTLVRRGEPFPAGLLAWGLLALVWVVPLAAILPFVYHVYDRGYWVPRAILAPVWGFLLLFFSQLDRFFSRWPAAGRWIGLAVAIQCLLQIGSIWY